MADENKKTLRDLLQGLIDTDSGVIDRIKNRFIKVEDKIGGIENQIEGIEGQLGNKDNRVDDLKDKVDRGSNSYALVDINSPDRGGTGTLVNDTSASHGQAIRITTSASANLVPISAVFSDIKFGHYAICARVKISSKTNNDVVQLKLINGTTEILAANFAGSQFSSTSQYCYLYSTFTYEAINGAKQPLTFQLHTHLIDGIQVSFDYVYISMIIPSVFL